MRNQYLVSYDISDPKRLRKMFKTMRGFGDHVQLSVFRCELSDKELMLLMEAISDLINHKEDQVLIVDVGPAAGRAKHASTFIGRPGTVEERRAVIV